MESNEQLVNAVLNFVRDKQEPDNRKKLSCAEAFELARKHEARIIEIGNICNQNKIRICKCQLGCFI